MSSETERKYIKTKFEGVFFRQSAKRDPRTGEYDKIYCFWYADHEGKGHWKTVGRHSKGIRPATARKERAKFLAEFEATGVNPIERDKVTIGDLVDAYLEWGRSEGKYVDQHYSQYNAHLKNKNSRSARCRADPESAFQSQGAAPEDAHREYKAQKRRRKVQHQGAETENSGRADREQHLLVHAFRHKPCYRYRHVERSQPVVHQGRHLENGKKPTMKDCVS